MPEIALPYLARSIWARRLLLPLVFVLALVFFLLNTFPYEALSQRIVSEARKNGYEVTLGSLSHAGIIGVSATEVTLKPISPDAAGGPLEIKLDKLTLKPEIFGLLFKKPAVAFNIEAYGGSARGVAKFSSDPKLPGLSSLQIDADSFDLKNLPASMLQGIEVIGQLSLQGDVNSLLALEASGGTINFTLKGGAIVKGQAMGIPLPKTMLGELSGGLTVDKGVVKLEKVQLKGGDIEGDADGTIRLKPLLAASQADLKIHLRPKDSWLDANPLVKGSLGFLGPKGGDGYTIPVTGSLAHMNAKLGNAHF